LNSKMLAGRRKSKAVYWGRRRRGAGEKKKGGKHTKNGTPRILLMREGKKCNPLLPQAGGKKGGLALSIASNIVWERRRKKTQAAAEKTRKEKNVDDGPVPPSGCWFRERVEGAARS